MTNDKIISASILRLRMKSPFFATLALFARFVPTSALPTAATDGRDIFYNPEFLTSLPPLQVDGLLLHEVLHAALLHVPRRGTRDRKWWNMAADIVVNGIIADRSDFELPPEGIRDPKLEQLSVEEIYELLLQKQPTNCDCGRDLLDESPQCSESEQSESEQSDDRDFLSTKNIKSGQLGGTIEGKENSDNLSGENNLGDNLDHLSSQSPSWKAAIEAHWKAAIQKAIAIDRSTNSQGTLPAGLLRQLSEITEPQLDWRSYLWRYLVRTPTDFVGFDRRFIGRGLYLDSLEGESVRVFVAVDTSGSIADSQMQTFLGEVCGILNAYPHIKGELYYVDATAYGPYEIEPNGKIPPPVGGGGTSFVPFFDAVRNTWDGNTNGVCIYLTDGYGRFPTEVPELPVLWVVTPGGLGLEQFPFGETVRLLH
jgi:predicted metal-dependent peptidase